MDILSILLPAGIGVIGAIIGTGFTYCISTVKQGQRLDDHEKRMNTIESKIDNLPTSYVPRQELEAITKNIQESLNRIEGWFQHYFLDKKE